MATRRPRWSRSIANKNQKYKRKLTKNLLIHEETGLVTWQGYVDLVNRSDKRYPEEKYAAVVFLWTKRANLEKLCKLKHNDTWKDNLLRFTDEVEVTDADLRSSSIKASESGRMSVVDGTAASLGGLGGQAKFNTRSKKQGLKHLRSRNLTIGSFCTLDPDMLHRKATEAGINRRSTIDGASPGTIVCFREMVGAGRAGQCCLRLGDSVFQLPAVGAGKKKQARIWLIELLTDLSYAEALKKKLDQDFEVAVPVYCPVTLLRLAVHESFSSEGLCAIGYVNSLYCLVGRVMAAFPRLKKRPKHPT